MKKGREGGSLQYRPPRGILTTHTHTHTHEIHSSTMGAEVMRFEGTHSKRKQEGDD